MLVSCRKGAFMARTGLAAVLLVFLSGLATGCEDPSGKNQEVAETEDVLPPELAAGDDAVPSAASEGMFTAFVEAPASTSQETAPALHPVAPPTPVAVLPPAPNTTRASTAAPATAAKATPEKATPEETTPTTGRPTRGTAGKATSPNPIEKTAPEAAAPGKTAPASPAPGATAPPKTTSATASRSDAPAVPTGVPPASGDREPAAALPAAGSAPSAETSSAVAPAPLIDPMAGVVGDRPPVIPPPPAPREDSVAAPQPAPPSSPADTRLTELRVGGHQGYDRIVFEFDGKLPPYGVDSLSAPAAPCRPGEAPAVAGNRWLAVRISGAAAAPSLLRYERSFRLSTLREMELVCGEGDPLVWVLGLESLRRVRVSALTRPTRLVIDVLH
jgi:hypothetical protein